MTSAGGVLAALMFITAFPRYAGSASDFVFFNLCFLLLAALIFPKPRVYVYTWLAGFLMLGFWLKVMVHAIWAPGFLEPIGDFSGSSPEWDAALLAASCGALGAALPRIIQLMLALRRASPAKKAPELAAPFWFRQSRRLVWALTIGAVLILNAINVNLAFHQVGVNPKLVLPYHLNVPLAWLIDTGFALWIATLVHWNFQLRKQSLLASLFFPMVEALSSSISSMSRLTFFLHAGSYWLVLMDKWRNWKSSLPPRKTAVLAACFAALLAISVLTVFWLRTFDFHAAALKTVLRESRDVAQTEGPANVSRRNAVLSYQWDVLVGQLPHLFVHRWVGLEGVLVVGSLTQRGQDLFVAAVTDDPRRGAKSLFQQHAKTPYLAEDAKTYTFLSNAGIIALLFYSGSFLFVFAGMALITAILIVSEGIANRATGNPFLLTVAGAAAANVACQMTFPYLSLIFLLQLWVAIVFLALVQRADPALIKISELTGRRANRRGVIPRQRIWDFWTLRKVIAFFEFRCMRFFTSEAMNKIPHGREVLQQTAMSGLVLSLALTALVSLNPYFMWNNQKTYYAVASLLLAVCFLGSYRLFSPSRFQLLLSAAFSLFLIYLSLLPKVAGAPTRWFFLIPFVIAFLTLNQDDRRKAFDKFYWIFALSLIPGMLVWLWMIAGLPIEMTQLTLAGHAGEGSPRNYIGVPGAIAVSLSGVILPNGGVMFRLCAIYDEPGTVGTIAALCLAVTRFRLREMRAAIVLIAGIMSFSLAFAVLSGLGVIGMAIAEKRFKLASTALVAIIIGAGALSEATFDLPTTREPAVTVVVPPSEGVSNEHYDPTKSPKPLSMWVGTRLRSMRLDGRAEPEMRLLLEKYANSPLRTILFGIASNASVVYGHESAVWYSVLTDYGLVGFVWLFLLYFAPVVLLWRAGRLDAPVVAFCTLYLMSFYQRPVIWLPAQMLVYYAGIYWSAAPGVRKKDSTRH